MSAPTPAEPAPDFPRDLPWLNSERPLSLEDLEGKLVLLEFWTYC